MDDPVFDFYKGFYKKASSWFLGTLIVLIVLIVIGLAYVTISKLKAKNDANQNTNVQTTTEQSNSRTDTEMDNQDLFLEQDLGDGSDSPLNSNSQSGRSLINPYGDGMTTNPNTSPGGTSLDELGL